MNIQMMDDFQFLIKGYNSGTYNTNQVFTYAFQFLIKGYRNVMSLDAITVSLSIPH